MLYITPTKLASVLDQDRNTCYRRLRGIPYKVGAKREGYFPLNGILPLLKPREAESNLPALYENSVWIESQWPEGVVEDNARAIETWVRQLPSDENGGPIFRLETFRRSFVELLAGSVQSKELLLHVEHLRLCLILDVAVQKWILLYDFTGLPKTHEDWLKWALNWALSHAPAPEELAA